MNKRFGSYRGLIRLLIANFLWWVGPYRRFARIDASQVRRLVFVCQGNICRSPFAHALAAGSIPDLPVRSMGLATSSGLPAFDTAISTARHFAVDLTSHRTTDVDDFEVMDGDLFLVMEDRHIEKLRPHIEGRDVQVGLLGLWCRPRFALLYDPHRLGPAYFATCFDRIGRAVRRLGQELERDRPKRASRAA